MPRSSPSLKKKFTTFNRTYFGGKLPEDTVVRYRRSYSTDANGRKQDMGECSPEKKLIHISPNIKGYECVVIMTLLHEMVHLKGIKNHGREFNREMLRLARAGAFNGRW